MPFHGMTGELFASTAVGVFVFVAAALAALVGLGLRVRSYLSVRPSTWHRGVGVRGIGVATWSDLPIAIDAVIETLPKVLDGAWIEVTSGPVDTPFAPAGYTPHGAEAKGSLKTERLFPVTSKHWVIVLKRDHRVPTARESGLFHEVAYHLRKFRAGQGFGGHDDPESIALERAMLAAYGRIREARDAR